MKQTISCSIETITSRKEHLWIITVANDLSADLIVLLTALQYSKLSHITFSGTTNHAIIRRNDDDSYALRLGQTSLPISSVWLEAIISMLLDVQIHGWSITSHLDQDFPTVWGNVCVCVRVAPPMQ
ncbi:MAG: hypothetical protein IKC09_01385 [Oscillospiraceae bacterium]|nr:hypothetical protein [Oscillospiraceae bacterium]